MSYIAPAINALLDAMEDSNSTDYDIDKLRRLCLDAERVLRNLFAVDRQNPILGNPYIGLVDFFDLALKARLARPRNWNEEGFPWTYRGVIHSLPQKHILSVPVYLRRSRGTACAVDTLSTFREAWDIFSGGALSAITDWRNIIVAGGSVLACLTASLSNQSRSLSRGELYTKFQSFLYKSSDIDLFLWGMSEEQVNNLLYAKCIPNSQFTFFSGEKKNE